MTDRDDTIAELVNIREALERLRNATLPATQSYEQLSRAVAELNAIVQELGVA